MKPLHSVTYLAMAEKVARQFAETVAESRTRFYFQCNDFEHRSASLGSHTSQLPSVNASAMFREICLIVREVARKIAQCDSALNLTRNSLQILDQEFTVAVIR